jgi:hypothetical protein
MFVVRQPPPIGKECVWNYNVLTIQQPLGLPGSIGADPAKAETAGGEEPKYESPNRGLRFSYGLFCGQVPSSLFVTIAGAADPEKVTMSAEARTWRYSDQVQSGKHVRESLHYSSEVIV